MALRLVLALLLLATLGGCATAPMGPHGATVLEVVETTPTWHVQHQIDDGEAFTQLWCGGCADPRRNEVSPVASRTFVGRPPKGIPLSKGGNPEDVFRQQFRRAFGGSPVAVVGTPTDGYVLTYDSTTGTWRAEAAASSEQFPSWSEDASGDIEPDTDNADDIGTAGKRPRTVYAGTSAVIAGTTTVDVDTIEAGSDLSVRAGDTTENAALRLQSRGGDLEWRILGTVNSGHLEPQADNAQDVGTATNGVRTLYADTSVVTPLLVAPGAMRRIDHTRQASGTTLSITVPAGTLDEAGDELVVRIQCNTGTSGNATPTVTFAGLTIFNGALAPSAKFYMELNIQRVTSTTVDLNWRYQHGTSASTNGGVDNTVADLDSVQTIQCAMSGGTSPDTEVLTADLIDSP